MADRRLCGGRKERKEVAPDGCRRCADRPCRTQLQLIACGFLFLAIALSTVRCGQTGEPAQQAPVVARIGVPEADVQTADSGLSQIAALLTLEGLTEETSDEIG